MHRRSAPLIDIVRMEEKETKLKSFVQVVSEKSDVADAACDQHAPILLIARSPESPVAKAVASLVRDGMIGRPIHAIFAIAPRGDASAAAAETLAALSADKTRVLRDVRLFDAHEQIVLSTSASWVGDCMRRDPMKRDAYECFAADCATTARWGQRSHERLWAMSDVISAEAYALAPSISADLAAANVVPADGDVSADPVSGSSS